MCIADFRPFAPPQFAVSGIAPPGSISQHPFPLFAVPCTDFLIAVFVQYWDSDSMAVRVLFILPPVRMGFINHDISVSISDKIPVFDFFISPRMIWLKGTHGYKQMHMWVPITLIMYAPVGTHAFVYKVFLNIVRCKFNLFLSAPFFRK